MQKKEEDIRMKGYYSTSGFFGLIDGVYVLFASESDYSDYYDAISDTEDTAA